jgi:hypothetical protein
MQIPAVDAMFANFHAVVEGVMVFVLEEDYWLAVVIVLHVVCVKDQVAMAAVRAAQLVATADAVVVQYVPWDLEGEASGDVEVVAVAEVRFPMGDGCSAELVAEMKSAF